MSKNGNRTEPRAESGCFGQRRRDLLLTLEVAKRRSRSLDRCGSEYVKTSNASRHDEDGKSSLGLSVKPKPKGGLGKIRKK